MQLGIAVSESLLDPAELEAIQNAIRESAPRGGLSRSLDYEPTRLALIADDRVAEAARPVALNLASRWVRPLTRALKPHLPGTWQVDPLGAEVIDGTIAREELRGGWVGCIAGADGEIVMTSHGSLIDAAAAKRCGSSEPQQDANRPPSAVSLRLFHNAGRSVLESWNIAWKEVFPADLLPATDLGIVARLIEARVLLRLVLSFTGDVGGRITIYVRPEMLVQPPPALAANRARAALVANALSNVPVEVIAELGTLRLQLREIKNLSMGTTFALHGFVDSKVPIYCGGVLKAWARPVVYRGVLGVQIESIVHDQGEKS